MRARPGDRAVTADTPSPRAARRVVIGVLVVALVAACNGGNDDTSTPVTTVPVASTAVTTIPPSTTSASATTAPTISAPLTAVRTVAATTSTPPTTLPPTAPPESVAAPTTIRPTAEERALEVLDGAYRVWRECGRALPECDPDALDQYMTDPLLGNRKEMLAEWLEQGYVVENVDSYTYEVLEVNLDFVIPYILVCERDGAVLIERRPGVEDRVIEHRYLERIREAQLLPVSDGWRVEGFATREEVEGEEGVLCG